MRTASDIIRLSPERLTLLKLLRESRISATLSLDKITCIPDTNIAPLSFAQQRLWIIDQLEPGNPAYNISQAMHLTGTINIISLQQSLYEIVRRHEVLRSAFIIMDKEPVQIITSPKHLPLPVIDISPLSQVDQEREGRRLVDEQIQQPFDLTQPTLFRSILLRLNDKEHILVVVVHHIVADGLSIKILFQELLTLYNAFSLGQPSPLPDLPIQYKDFARWQRQWLQGEILERQLSYWRYKLGDNLPILDLPTDYLRPPTQTFRGASQILLLSGVLVEQLKSLSQQEHATLFMTIVAAFKVLLHRYTHQDDIVVGTPIAGRNRYEVSSLIGLFVNTLVLRTKMHGNPSFRELLKQVRQVCLEAYDHQDLPFEKLVKELQPERNLSHQPLFQVEISKQESIADEALSFQQVTWKPLEVGRKDAKFDLLLHIQEQGQELRIELNYNTDLFEETTITRMQGHFQILLQAIASEPDQQIDDLPLLTNAERDHQLATLNATVNQFPLNLCFIHLFEHQVVRTPDSIAVVSQNQQLTYQALNKRANQLAYFLADCGVTTDSVVILLAERGIDFLTAMLAIFKAGGAYLPLDPAHPTQRLVQVLGQSRASLVVVARAFEPVLVEVRGQMPVGQQPILLCLETLLAQADTYKCANLPAQVTPGHLAYVIYTSGSTGVPKGAMVEQKGMLNHLYAKVCDLGLTADDIVAQNASQCFDISVWQFLAALVVGGAVHIFSDELAHDPQQLLQTVAQQGITILEVVPSVLRMMLEAMTQQPQGGPSLAHLRRLIPTGEALSPALARQWFAHYPTIPLVNAYGPTECSDDVTHYVVPGPPSQTTINMPIGRPIANMRVYVLDKQLCLVPQGVIGELYVAGVGVGRGYVRNPQHTATSFLPDPFSTTPGARLYKTGDLVRYLPDGNLEFLGRVDYQVKMRGFRIELGEIEAILAQHSAVRNVVVVAREDPIGAQRLVAYVVAQAAMAVSQNDLRLFLQEKLPTYMIPSAFVLMPELPLTPNGKINRQALPAPDFKAPGQGNSFVAPRVPMEETLAAIWQEVLGVTVVGVHDNFFSIGGDSILGIQVVIKARQAGLKFTPTQLFQYQTIAELVTVVDVTSPIQIEQGLVTGPLPLTAIQHWFFEQKLLQPNHFNQAVFLEVRTQIKPEQWKRALQQLLEHHDALRQRFHLKESSWQQFVADPDLVIPFSLVDVVELPESDQITVLQTMAAALQGSLNLSEGPLVQMVVFDLGKQKPNRLLWAIHHLIVDAVSWRILLNDLQILLKQTDPGEKIQLPPKTTSFKQWSERLTAHAQSETIKQELTYWAGQLRYQTDRLPTDFDFGINSEASARTVSVFLNSQETHSLLRELPVVYHTQINDILLTALLYAVSKWTEQPWLYTDLEIYGREDIFEDVDLSRTVGWFTTFVPIRLHLEAADAPGGVLRSVKEQLGGILSRGISFGLLRYLNKEPAIIATMHKLPSPEIIFNYLGQLDNILTESSIFAPAHEEYGPVYNPYGIRSHVLEVNARVVGGQLHASFIYSENLHKKSTIEKVAQDFREALISLLAYGSPNEVTGYTPSDFSKIQLSQREIDKLMAKIK